MVNLQLSKRKAMLFPEMTAYMDMQIVGIVYWWNQFWHFIFWQGVKSVQNQSGSPNKATTFTEERNFFNAVHRKGQAIKLQQGHSIFQKFDLFLFIIHSWCIYKGNNFESIQGRKSTQEKVMAIYQCQKSYIFELQKIIFGSRANWNQKVETAISSSQSISHLIQEIYRRKSKAFKAEIWSNSKRERNNQWKIHQNHWIF